ncbi:MAG: DNA translocase FtsK 4TM domain-containing protein [Firmicutes bacterium]|nr:DNA translocase FtsK 4TM domain-containing protein [Bacillota bacterium]
MWEFLGDFKEEIRREVLGIALLAAAALLAAGLYSEAAGVAGEFIKRISSTLSGRAAWALPLSFAALGISVLIQRDRTLFARRLTGLLSLFLILVVYLHRPLPPDASFFLGVQGEGGGILGAALSRGFSLALGAVGTSVVLVAWGLVAVSLVTGLSLQSIGAGMTKRLWFIARAVWNGMVSFVTESAGSRAEVVMEEETVPRARATEPLPTEDSSLDEVPFRNRRSEPGGRGDERPASASRVRDPERAGVRDGRPPVVEDLTLPDQAPAATRIHRQSKDDFRLPPLAILQRPPRAPSRADKDLADNGKLLEETLESFGVRAKVVRISRGPTITRYEIQPAPGVKVSRILNLSDDIALNMAAADVRIEAPIPGKAALGIEVPNRVVSTVFLREVLETQEFEESQSRLTVGLGKDIAGQVVMADLAKMPHLLIAGTTGSGKSVCLNVIVASIIFKASPDEVKFLMIDPKVVELNTYNGIPHLIAPVVTEPKKAAGALRWVLREMQQRYELFAGAGVKDIMTYNKLISRRGDAGLPLIVVIIDELADLMMVAAHEVEDYISRLAHMARAAGIHLVIGTQRPSVDVITGVIKANIPSRVSFAVSSQTDSRTILDSVGAEKLLGKGDMLYYPWGAPKPIRMQGAFISDREVDELVLYVKNQAEPEYREVMGGEDEPSSPQGDEDVLFWDALSLVVHTGQASVSLLQRRFRVGYTRAARLIDQMEERGFVGGYEGSKPRQVLLGKEQWKQLAGTRGDKGGPVGPPARSL